MSSTFSPLRTIKASPWPTSSMTMASGAMPKGKRSRPRIRAAPVTAAVRPLMLTRGHQAHSARQSPQESAAAAKGTASMGRHVPESDARASTTRDSGAQAVLATPMSHGAATGTRQAASTATNPTRHARANRGLATRLASGDSSGSWEKSAAA